MQKLTKRKKEEIRALADAWAQALVNLADRQREKTVSNPSSK